MVNSFTATELRNNLRFFGMPLRGNDEVDLLADRLLSGVPEHSLGRFVPARDYAVESLADDCVIRRGYDRREPRLFALCLISRCDVACNARYPHRPIFGITHR